MCITMLQMYVCRRSCFPLLVVVFVQVIVIVFRHTMIFPRSGIGFVIVAARIVMIVMFEHGESFTFARDEAVHDNVKDQTRRHGDATTQTGDTGPNEGKPEQVHGKSTGADIAGTDIEK